MGLRVDPDATVLDTVRLGTPWATVDPFLFCVHHLDHYPAGTATLAPAADLRGRQLGNDFSGRDGWSMYHGLDVPGFPQHPHRGFETVTYVRRGIVDHSDSLGATARFGRGDVQWLTAGRGINHAEMFPLLDPEGPNTLELFQIWLNLPATDKFVEPYFTMLWADQIPVLQLGEGAQLTVIAGPVGAVVPPSPPPNSWASRPEAEVAIWHVTLEAGASCRLPAAPDGKVRRMLYIFSGDGVTVDGTSVGAGAGALVRAEVEAVLETGGSPVEVLVLQGRPIGEPVVQHGPFVMNTRQQIIDAFDDYRRTAFGGWPWPDDAPTHGPKRGRFARHPDGRVESPIPG
jgi:redox-sensitive bicupin YhaK (pirin superfamily)